MDTHCSCPSTLRSQYIGPGFPHTFAPSGEHGRPISVSACAGPLPMRTAIGATAVNIAKPTTLGVPMIHAFLDNIRYITIELNGLTLYDTRDEVPCDMDKWRETRARDPRPVPCPLAGRPSPYPADGQRVDRPWRHPGIGHRRHRLVHSCGMHDDRCSRVPGRVRARADDRAYCVEAISISRYRHPVRAASESRCRPASSAAGRATAGRRSAVAGQGPPQERVTQRRLERDLLVVGRAGVAALDVLVVPGSMANGL